MSSSSSPLENIHNAIENSNPFSIKFVDQHHIWGAGFPDVPEINAHISDAVFSAIDQVSREEIPSIGIIITGEKGLGKTQVISRIRHRLQEEGNTFFVYMGNYGDLNHIKSEFLQTLISSLKRTGTEGITQWQELAANIFFTARGDRPCTAKELANGVFESNVKKKPNTPEIWTNAICKKKPELNNPYLVKAILWTLSENHAAYATSWLSGQELTQAKADELGLPNNSQKDELATFNTTRELLALIAHYNNLVFCFDELDDPSCNAMGDTRAVVVSALAKDLRNTISKCVLLMAMYPTTLQYEIKQFGGQGQGSAAAYDRTADQVLELDYLNSETSVALVNRWLQDFYSSKNLIPPHQLYPFNEEEIRKNGKERPTAREVLKWCSENWKIPTVNDDISDDSISPTVITVDSLETAFENELKSVADSIDEYMENNTVLGKALFYAFKAILNQEIEGVKVTSVEWIDDLPTTRNSDKGYLHLKIIGEENGRVVKIGVAAILQSTGRFVGAALKRLIDYERFNFTRGCLIRSHKISSGAGIPQKCVRELLDEKGGEWPPLLKEQIQPLIAISFIFEKLENYELTEEKVYKFIAEKGLAIDNLLVREILSDPSGQEPPNLIDDELPIILSSGTDQDDDLEL